VTPVPHLTCRRGRLGDVHDADLSFLSDELRASAIPTATGEVMWPRSLASDAVIAIAASGRIVLGLDLRSDGEGTTPPGLATEVPWTAFHPGRHYREGVLEAAREDALVALKKPELNEMSGYEWVLITWADA